MKILVLSGANINFTGIREKDVYGTRSFADLEQYIRDGAAAMGVEVRLVQSNHEGVLIDAIQQAWLDGLDGIVFNPGGYTHTSISLHDAIASVPIPTVEVHMSNILARETFRHTSLTAPACKGQISGFGFDTYLLAIRGLLEAAE